MKNLLCAPLALVLVLFAVIPTNAALTNFTFLNGFSGLNEVGPNASTGGGSINTLQYDDSVGTFGTFSVDVSFSGLSASASAAHIHGLAGVGTNTGVLQGLTATAATAGTISGTWTIASAAHRDGLFGGLTYLNIHNSTFTGGELRGQLIPIPEPSVLGLSSLGLGLLVMRWRQKR